MANTIIHREEFAGVTPRFIATKVQELAAKHPGAKVTSRHNCRYGTFSITVSVPGATREQARGHCQFCGNDQALGAKGVVLHGYERPGTGYTFGRCPGVGFRPQEQDITMLTRWCQEQRMALAESRVRLADRTQASTKANAVWYAKSDAHKTEAMNNRPSYTAINRTQPHHPEEVARRQQYETELAQWAKKYKACSAWHSSHKALRAAQSDEHQQLARLNHFEGILARKLLGQPLITVTK